MLAKLYAWNLDFSQVAIIDSDALVIGPLTEAFSLLRLSSSSIRLAAALAPTKPIPTEFVTDKFAGHFNAGVLFIKPSQEHYDALVKHSQDKSYYRLELAEQNLLNEYYGGRFLGLPSTYNLSKCARNDSMNKADTKYSISLYAENRILGPAKT